jgi:hypothetical protein
MPGNGALSLRPEPRLPRDGGPARRLTLPAGKPDPTHRPDDEAYVHARLGHLGRLRAITARGRDQTVL